MQRWYWIIFAIALGLGLGLLYGWVISPVRYTDTTPETLRPDHRAEYALAVAEIFHSENNAALADQRLQWLGGDALEAAVEALTYARQAGWSANDTLRLETLVRALGGTP